MQRARPFHQRLIRGLRFRLTLTYLVFFTVLLTFIGLFFRETMQSLYDRQIHSVLTEEWAAVRGYLRIDKPVKPGAPPVVNWYYDRDDPEEALIVDRLRQVYLLADADGDQIEVGPKYRELQVDPADHIRRIVEEGRQTWQVREDPGGTRYLIRSGVVMSEDERPYYLAIGRSYAEGERIVDQFTFRYFWILPLMIVSACVLGWFMAGRALTPVNQVAQTAQRITGSNLTVQIPERGSGDELDRLIDAFNRMIERLDQSFRMTRQFSTDVSHELRTPLTAIRGQLEVALLTARTQDDYRQAIENALQDVERLSQTIRALLLLSQAESGQFALQKETLDIGGLVEDIVDQFQIPAESGGILLTSHHDGAVPVEADRVQIQRLLSNLISNAIKYTPSGGEVRVVVADAGDQIRVTVADTGVGISESHLPYIFDRCYRVPAADPGVGDDSPERGLGLGLSFVAWITKAHGGRVEVTSEPGKGTTFTVHLPKGNVTQRAAGTSARLISQ